MSIALNNGLIFQTNDEDLTAVVDASPDCYESVDIPNQVECNSKIYTVIGINSTAFRYNNNIKSISFEKESTVQHIERGAFAFSTIEKISIPDNMKNIESGAFNGASKLIEFEISPENHRFCYYNQQMLIKKLQKKGDYRNILIFVRQDIEEIMIPNDVIRIGEMAFALNNHIKSVTFEPHSILRSIEKDAFFQCSIKSLQLPSKLDNLEKGWCHGINDLCNIEVSNNNKSIKYIRNRYLIKLGEKSNHDTLLFARRDIKEAMIPDRILKIDDYAFESCIYLKSLSFGNANSESSPILEEIGTSAFCCCSKLQNVAPIPFTVKTIGDNAFQSCQNMSFISFQPYGPDGQDPELTYLGESAFQACSELQKVHGIPASMKICKKNVFQFDEHLQFVEFLAEEIEIDNLAFGSNPELEIISLPNAKNITMCKSSFTQVSKDFKIVAPKSPKVTLNQEICPLNEEQKKGANQNSAISSFFGKMKDKLSDLKQKNKDNKENNLSKSNVEEESEKNNNIQSA